MWLGLFYTLASGWCQASYRLTVYAPSTIYTHSASKREEFHHARRPSRRLVCHILTLASVYPLSFSALSRSFMHMFPNVWSSSRMPWSLPPQCHLLEIKARYDKQKDSKTNAPRWMPQYKKTSIAWRNKPRLRFTVTTCIVLANHYSHG